LTEEDRRKQKKHWGWGNNLTQKVFKRDRYACIVCGKKGGELASHHLESWNTNPGKRFDIDNVVTLCKQCHNGFHRQYGRGDNTQKQFDEFSKSGRVLCRMVA
jgi:5-methylcytosine-specific restriction endonuclease McrA